VRWFLSETFRNFLNILLPRHCLSCSNLVAEDGFCASCWQEISILSTQLCKRCYRQMQYNLGIDYMCTSCSCAEFYLDLVRAPMKYNYRSKIPILKYKNKAQTHLAQVFAKMIWWHVQELEIDYVVSVPLNKFRLFWRGYNQADVLALGLAKLLQISHISDVLRRNKFTPQEGLNKSQRKNNIHGAFEMNKSICIKGKNLLLVDDVYTTGATAEECARILKKAGAGRVYGAFIAKT